jgi:hypothetical protein
MAAVLSLSVAEIIGRWVGYDFSGREQALRETPVWYRIPTVPVAEVFFRRPGPDEWTGKVLTVALKRWHALDEAYEDEPEITVRYDSRGFRNPESLIDWQIAVVGDSFVEAGNLPYEQMFTTRLARILGVTVKNLGVSHTGPLTQVRYLREFGVAPGTRHAVLVFFEGNDPRDVVREHHALRRFARTGLRPYRTVPKQTSFLRALWSLFSRSEEVGDRSPEPRLYRNATFRSQDGEIDVSVGFAPAGRKDLPPGTDAILESAVAAWAREARAFGLTPWLAYMPGKRRALHESLTFLGNAETGVVNWVPGDLPNLLREMCAGHEVRFIDFTPALAAASARGILTFNPIVDSHLNAAGDEVVAETLAEQMSEIVSGAQPESGPLG